MAIKQRTKSLSARESSLSDAFIQLDVLQNKTLLPTSHKRFDDQLSNLGGALKPSAIEILQINIGKLCNQTCAHCHVDAGPDKKRENMDKATLEKCLGIIEQTETIHTVDITGGAPELNPHFRWFVKEARALGKQVIDRCNLTIIRSNKKYHTLPSFFAENNVQVVSSLPYFSKSRTDSQRGDGVFEDSIKALQMLNEVGYGKPNTGLMLHLVYNPSGAFLPASQETLEAEFKRQLKRKYGIEFNQLFCITNLPISRFLDYLLESGNYPAYMEKLVEAFNPATFAGLMCRNTLSISWDGFMYDCDFNQMLDLKIAHDRKHIDNFNNDILNREIVTNEHCYGCTAGAGSSCGGELV